MPRAGSIYPQYFEGLKAYRPNVLLYAVAGTIARVTGVLPVMRLALVAYVVGCTFAVGWLLYKQRLTVWPAVLVPAICYNAMFEHGFVNWLLAIPPLLLFVERMHAVMTRPSWGRYTAAAALLLVTYWLHVQMFLFAGLLAIPIALFPFRGVKRTAIGVAVAIPAAVPFLLWFRENFLHATQQLATSQGGKPTGLLAGAVWLPYRDYLVLAAEHTMGVVRGDEGYRAFFVFLATLTLASVFRRGESRERKLLQLVAALSVASYVALPAHSDANAMIGTRQLVVAWFASVVFLAPPPCTPGRGQLARSLARVLVITGGLGFASMHLDWVEEKWRQWDREVAGLERALEGAPWRGRLARIVYDDWSLAVLHSQMWHFDKYYVATRFGVTWDMIAKYYHCPVRLKGGVELPPRDPPIRFWDVPDLSQKYDVLLAFRLPQALVAEGAKHYALVGRSGDFAVFDLRKRLK